MTTIKIVPSIASNNQNLYTGRMYSCLKCTASQKWYNRRRFK